MMDIQTAKELLEAATHEDAEDYPRPRVLAQLERQAPDAWRVLTLAAEALGKANCQGCATARHKVCDRCKALAEFRKL